MKQEKIGNILQMQRGYDLPTSQMREGNIPVVGSNGIVGYHDTSKCIVPTITIGRSGSAGKIHMYESPTWVHNTALYITDFKGNSPKYLYYLLQLLHLESLCGSSVIPSLNRNVVYPMTINFHESRVEQDVIADLLAKIDSKIALNREINRNLEAMSRLLYDYWFVQFDFPDENGKPYKSSGGKMVWNKRLKRDIPENWEVENLADAAEIYNGATPSTAIESNYGGDIVWITPKDLSDQQCKFVYYGSRNISQQGYDSCSTHMLPSRSLLMSSRAPIGLLSISEVPLCTNQGFKSLVPKEGYDVYYFYYVINRQLPKIEQLGTGTTFKEVSREDLMRFPILRIPHRIQQEWLLRVERMAERQFKGVLESDKLKNKRDELLPLLMNGQVSVMPT